MKGGAKLSLEGGGELHQVQMLAFLLPSRPKEGISVLKDIKCKEDTSSDSEDKIAAINKNLSFGKRKPDLLMDGGEVVEKRKKGRPRKDKMAAPIAQPFTQVERRRNKMYRNTEVAAVCCRKKMFEMELTQNELV